MTQKFWDEKLETMPDNNKRSVQFDNIKRQLQYVYDHIPFYKKLFDRSKINVSSFLKLKDLAKFPFTLKKDMAQNYPFGMSAVQLGDLVRIHASSGTTGKPALGFYTAFDLEQWTECMARALWAQEVRPDSVFQNANGMGLFTGGMGFLQGASRIGCVIIPSGVGMTERQITLMIDLGTTALTCTASYVHTIFERAEAMGVDIKKLKLRTGHFGAEPWSEQMRTEIENRGGFKAYEHYGLTEMMGPGVAFNCEQYRLHVNEDHVYPEIVDPVTLEPMEEGQHGELVLTALQRQAMPLIRYRTRDICSLSRIKCECGRTLITMDKVMGRTDDVMIISGVNVFPSQIETALMSLDFVEPIYQIRLRKKGYSDSIVVETELKAETYDPDSEQNKDLARKIGEKIRQIVGIKAPVIIMPKGAIPRSSGKAKRVMEESQV
jgi:phenylacetate-CoA ligase